MDQNDSKKEINVTVIGKQESKNLTIEKHIENEKLKMEELGIIENFVKKNEINDIEGIFAKDGNEFFIKYKNGSIYRYKGDKLKKVKEQSILRIEKHPSKTSLRIEYDDNKKIKLLNEENFNNSFNDKLKELLEIREFNKKQFENIRKLIENNKKELKNCKNNLDELKKAVSYAEDETKKVMKKYESKNSALWGEKKNLKVFQYVLKNLLKLKILSSKVWHPKRSIHKEWSKLFDEKRGVVAKYYNLKCKYEIECEREAALQRFNENLNKCSDSIKYWDEKLEKKVKKIEKGLNNKDEDFNVLKEDISKLNLDNYCAKKDMEKLLTNHLLSQKTSVLDWSQDEIYKKENINSYQYQKLNGEFVDAKNKINENIVNIIKSGYMGEDKLSVSGKDVLISMAMTDQLRKGTKDTLENVKNLMEDNKATLSNSSSKKTLVKEDKKNIQESEGPQLNKNRDKSNTSMSDLTK